MASIFTYQDEPHRVHSPWSTPGSSTPQIAVHVQGQEVSLKDPEQCHVTKLEPEKHDGPIEYKLHLLLRWRRAFTYSSTAGSMRNGHLLKFDPNTAAFSPTSLETLPNRSSTQPSNQTRQARLQQLTTQLLWRLQQSSPFHSSSNAKLVLPVLPEATPRLGVPERPSKLLPGLEESQGALYEIGVADDGTLVGLADEEMEESLTNLRAMAASLGCVVDLHRRVIVGDCEWFEDDTDGQSAVAHSSKLWVAEVLVRPDNKSVEVVPANAVDALQTLGLQSNIPITQNDRAERQKEHLRIALLGASAAGKSSLLGTLTTSVLDNGRGKSRLSLLKHRHEVASGITSSVAQELLGYQSASSGTTAVINYATGDVSAWPDIHNLSDRLVFLSDSPGLPRYSKSTFRALISWDPAWIVLCIPADEQVQHGGNSVSSNQPPTFQGRHEPAPEANLSMVHLDLCLKLDRPFLIAITKMDLATKTGLRTILSHVLSTIKAAGKTPLLMNTPVAQAIKRDDLDFAHHVHDLVTQEQSQIDQKLRSLVIGRLTSTVPIVMTSAVTGSGIASLHSLLRTLPSYHETSSGGREKTPSIARTLFRTDEVFAIPPSKVYSAPSDSKVTDSGVVLCGLLESGTITLGDELCLGPFLIEPESINSMHARAMRRTSSHHAKPVSNSLPRSLSENFSKSLQLQTRLADGGADSKVQYITVKVVSLRNLRLPVSKIHAGDTGTVGIQTIAETDASVIPLSKARKGMVLLRSIDSPQGYRSFTALFPYSDFGGSASPPLILGGHAIAYIHSIRAVVKVTAVALEDDENEPRKVSASSINTASTSPHDEVFSFEDDDEEEHNPEPQTDDDRQAERQGKLKISFSFITTVEYLEVHDQVLVVPNVTPAGPIAGPAPISTISGLSGFVGRVCEMHL